MSYHPAHDAIDYTGFAIPSGTPDRHGAVEVVRDVRATMRDGVELGADLYLPAGAGPVPAVLIRMPYGKETPDMGMRQVGEWLARKGYACVVQDVRGKFSSGGVFDPGVNEVDDGHDTVEWASRAAWCDGRVGLWGESYYGFTSLAAATSGHPAILAIAPGDIASDRRRAWFRGGAFQVNTTGYWAMTMDDPGYADITGADPYHLPLVDLPRTVGLEGRFLRGLLEHAEDAAWWAPRTIHHRLDRIRCAVLAWGGWYDTYIGPQLDDVVRLSAVHPHPERIHLLVGPWDHEGSAGMADRAVCMPIPDTAQHRWDAYQAFFDRYLRGDENGFGADGRADVFTLGASRWQRLPAWPPPAAVETPLYLRTGGRLAWEPPAADEAPDTYVYDPADPLPETIGGNCWALATALGDRRRFDDRADVLRYVSEPLPHDLELTGPVTAVLHAATSAVDTDFTVALGHVMADGTVNTIQDGIIRARYRDGMDAPRLLEPGELVEYRIALFATSYVVPAGERLRVDVSSSAFDRYDRNLNTAALPGTSAEIVVAEQAVHHAPGRASHVLLPVVGPAPGAAGEAAAGALD